MNLEFTMKSALLEAKCTNQWKNQMWCVHIYWCSNLVAIIMGGRTPANKVEGGSCSLPSLFLFPCWGIPLANLFKIYAGTLTIFDSLYFITLWDDWCKPAISICINTVMKLCSMCFIPVPPYLHQTVVVLVSCKCATCPKIELDNHFNNFPKYV